MLLPFAFARSSALPKDTASPWCGRTITNSPNNSNGSSASTCRLPPTTTRRCGPWGWHSPESRSRVIEFLQMLGQSVVVIDPVPDAEIVEQSRVRSVELLTGDATRDGTLELCNLPMARALIALTSSDTTNLEVALGARRRTRTCRWSCASRTMRSPVRSDASSRRSRHFRPPRWPLALSGDAVAHRIRRRGLQRRRAAPRRGPDASSGGALRCSCRVAEQPVPPHRHLR
jgi:hypothetical protein